MLKTVVFLSTLLVTLLASSLSWTAASAQNVVPAQDTTPTQTGASTSTPSATPTNLFILTSTPNPTETWSVTPEPTLTPSPTPTTGLGFPPTDPLPPLPTRVCQNVHDLRACAFNDTQISFQDEELTISNLNSSGGFGVEVLQLGRHERWDIEIGGLDFDDPIDSSLSISEYTGFLPVFPMGKLTFINQGNDTIEVVPDYSAYGTMTYTVDIYQNGERTHQITEYDNDRILLAKKTPSQSELPPSNTIIAYNIIQAQGPEHIYAEWGIAVTEYLVRLESSVDSIHHTMENSEADMLIIRIEGGPDTPLRYMAIGQDMAIMGFNVGDLTIRNISARGPLDSRLYLPLISR